MPHGKQSLLDSPRMRLGEIIFGWCYMPYYLLLTPLLITLGLALAGREYDIYKVNLIYFYVNFLVLAFGCRRFLTTSLQQTDLIRLLQAVLIAYGVQVICSLVIDILTAFLPSYENPADNATRDMILAHGNVMAVCAVLLGPLSEEILMRGLIFAPLARRNRAVAYLVSTLAFSSLHLLGYIGQVPVWQLGLALLDYLPGSIALALCYEIGGTIWCPIVLHMLCNGLSVLILSLF